MFFRFMLCLLSLIFFISATSWSQIIKTQQYWSLRWDIYWTFQSCSVINWSLKIIKALSIVLHRVHLPWSLSRASSQEHMASIVTKTTCQVLASPCRYFNVFGRSLFSVSLKITKCCRKADSRKFIIILKIWLLTLSRKNLTAQRCKKIRWTCTL